MSIRKLNQNLEKGILPPELFFGAKEQQEEIRIIKLQLGPDQLGSLSIGPPSDD